MYIYVRIKINKVVWTFTTIDLYSGGPILDQRVSVVKLKAVSIQM